jgi:AraC family transcriptional regulator of adaptative response / DNA-3-methyladenine glycosylase II
MDSPKTIDNSIPDSASCYRALAARDARFDGVFFTGIKSTGVYCRPVCSAKTPLLRSCTFFASAASAEQAGFRPCLRCRPELAPYALQQNLAYAIWQRIVAGALNDGNLERLADEVGLSSRQIRRVLLQHFGVTPVELAQTQRLLFAKKLLQETTLPMAEIAFVAGFGSVRRFNALFATRYGLAPSALRGRARAPDTSLCLRLAYRPPFDWPGMLQYLLPRALRGVEVIDLAQLSYRRTVWHPAGEGWMMLRQDPKRHQLILELAPELMPVLAQILMPLLARVRQQFDLDANPGVIEAHLSQEPMFARHLSEHPGLRVPGTFDGFELGLRTILGQQVSVAGASTLMARLIEQFGQAANCPWPGLSHHCPRAEVLASTPADELARIGIPLSRAETIRHFSQFCRDGGLLFKPNENLEKILAQLQSVRGIGSWSAHYIALRALRFPDAFPAGDLGLQKFAAPNGQRLSEKALLARAQPWSPWRAYAAMALWQGGRFDSPESRPCPETPDNS